MRGEREVRSEMAPTEDGETMDPMIGQATLGVYAVLLAVGGVMGYVKAKSRPSLIAGIGSAVAAIATLAAVRLAPAVGYPLGALLAVALLGFFGPRFARSRKFMPAGLMAILSLIVLAVMVTAALAGRTA